MTTSAPACFPSGALPAACGFDRNLGPFSGTLGQKERIVARTRSRPLFPSLGI